MSEKNRVLVVGGSGYLGQHVIRALKEKGFWIRALSRSAERIEPVRPYIDDLIIGEAVDPSSLDGICDGIDIVFSSLGITRQKDGLSYMDVDYQGNKNILDQALKSNTGRFMYISALNAEKYRHIQILSAKEKFADELKASGIDYTVVRPCGFFSDMKAFLDMAEKGRVYLFGRGNMRSNPIHGADLAEVCVGKLQLPGGEYDLGGPEILTQNEIARIAFSVLKKPVKITYIPLWIMGAILWFARRLTSVKTYGPLEFFVTVLAVDMIGPVSGHRTLKEFFESI